MHITRELLQAVARGEVSPRLLAEAGLEHLTQLCLCCQEEYEAWRCDPKGRREARPELLLPLLGAAAPHLERAERDAMKDFLALAALPTEKRIATLRRAHSRYRGPQLVHLLLAEGRNRLHHDPGAAYDFAAAALAVADRTNPPFELSALSAAAMANARRAAGELREADEHFAYARMIAERERVTDPAALAELDDLEASLRKDQRRFDRAELLLSRAQVLYRLAGHSNRMAKATVKLADVFFYSGKLREAIASSRTALRAISHGATPHLYLCARHNLAWYLAASEDFEEALAIYRADAGHFRRHGAPLDQLRRRWLRARIAAGLGHSRQAERAFHEVQADFLERGMGFYAALVSMDLAELHLRAGRTAKVRELAEQMVPIFAAQDVHREALAALHLFVEAARADAVHLNLVADLRNYLRNAQTDREHRFR